MEAYLHGGFDPESAMGVPVCDVLPPKRASRAGRGNSDEIDAVAAARTALATEVERLGSPRMDGIRSALRVLLVGRQAMDARRTAERNALTALVRGFALGLDARKPLSDAQVQEIASWLHRGTDDARQQQSAAKLGV